MGFKDIIDSFFASMPKTSVGDLLASYLTDRINAEHRHLVSIEVAKARDPYRDDPDIATITAAWDKYGEGATVVAMLRHSVGPEEAAEILNPHGAGRDRCGHEHDCCGCVFVSNPLKALDADEEGKSFIWKWGIAKNI